MNYLAILLLFSASLAMIVYAGSSSAAAVAPSPTPTPTEIPSFASFFECIFGVRIFPGADQVGAYTVNAPTATSGQVSGHMTYSYNNRPISGTFVYLGDEHGLPLGSYNTTTDASGYYLIDNIPLGNYHVYYSKNKEMAEEGHGSSAGWAYLSAAAPKEVVDITIEVS
jgi:hypothetical protein